MTTAENSAKENNTNKQPKTAKIWRRDGLTTLTAYGEPMVWLAGGGLAIALIMILGLLTLVFYQGVFTLWPKDVLQISLRDGSSELGEVARTQSYEPSQHAFDSVPQHLQEKALEYVEANDGFAKRILLRTANYELTNEHFKWVSDYEIAEKTQPEWAMVLERTTWGRFYGFPKAFYREHPLEDASLDNLNHILADMDISDKSNLKYMAGGRLLDLSQVSGDDKITAVVELWQDPEDVWKMFKAQHGKVLDRLKERRRLEKKDMGAISHRQEKARLDERKAQLLLQQAIQRYGADSTQAQNAAQKAEQAEQHFKAVEQQSGKEFEKVRAEIIRLNEINNRSKLELETMQGQTKTIELSEIVRAYPANRLNWFGKVSVYISRWWEFLTADPREANMEGGVFPAIFGTVIMTLIMSVAVVPFGVLAALYLREYAKAGPMISAVRIAINNLAGVPSIVFGVFGLGFFCYFVGAGIDELFFEAKLPNPTFGTGGIMWASFTLALLTLPVVIVATEEALAAVPGSMREGSYACGAGKWQTLRRIVLPRAMPGIMTGMILAMARGAGEVAPLMLVGAVKMAPELPIDGVFPYIHPQRSFMHLGFHIFDLGFQSQNSEAAKPMVFTTTLLLIAIVACLNFLAIIIRTRLRRNFVANVF